MRQNYNYMGSGHPNDPRWNRNSNVEAKWCVTRRAPVMQLLAAGKIWGFTMSMAPPEALIGRSLGLHVGGSHIPLKDISDSARASIALLNGLPFDEWRAGLKTWEERDPGAFVGSAKLVAAFQTAGITQECVRPYRMDRMGRHYLGDWRRFFGKQIRPVGNWSERRWVWCFENAAPTPANGADAAHCRGYGWVWDAAKGIRQQQNQLKGVA